MQITKNEKKKEIKISYKNTMKYIIIFDGFGGLVVRMPASGPRVRGFKRGRSRWIFLYIKILNMPSFGEEVK
jgi:hypothetical protein